MPGCKSSASALSSKQGLPLTLCARDVLLTIINSKHWPKFCNFHLTWLRTLIGYCLSLGEEKLLQIHCQIDLSSWVSVVRHFVCVVRKSRWHTWIGFFLYIYILKSFAVERTRLVMVLLSLSLLVVGVVVNLTSADLVSHNFPTVIVHLIHSIGNGSQRKTLATARETAKSS